MHPVPLTIRICYMYRYLSDYSKSCIFLRGPLPARLPLSSCTWPCARLALAPALLALAPALLALAPALGWPWPLRCRMALRGPLALPGLRHLL